MTAFLKIWLNYCYKGAIAKTVHVDLLSQKRFQISLENTGFEILLLELG